jgi:hypothetical protein
LLFYRWIRPFLAAGFLGPTKRNAKKAREAARR